MVPLDEVVPAERNPKRHDAAGIAASLDRLGYVEAIVRDDRTGRLVSGHGRTEALLARRAGGGSPPDGVELDGEGRWLVPVQVGWSSANDDEARAAVIALNRLVERGGWEARSLADDLQALAEAPDLMAVTGYGGDDLAKLLAGLAGPTSPAEFPEFGDDIETEHECPKCAYRWSGSSGLRDFGGSGPEA